MSKIVSDKLFLNDCQNGCINNPTAVIKNKVIIIIYDKIHISSGKNKPENFIYIYERSSDIIKDIELLYCSIDNTLQVKDINFF